MLLQTNVRLDYEHTTENFNKVLDAFKNYALDHSGTKFLLAQETGTQTGKPHYQGWCFHPSQRSAFRTFTDRAFSDLKGGKKAISMTRKPESEYKYICDHKDKPGFKFEDCITNYTQEEYDAIIDSVRHLPQFVSKEEFFAKKSKQNNWWSNCLDALEKQCVVDGRILYSMLPTVFFEQPQSKRMSKLIAKENLNGMIYELERRHLSNTRYKDELMESVMHDPIFKASKEEQKLFKKHNNK